MKNLLNDFITLFLADIALKAVAGYLEKRNFLSVIRYHICHNLGIFKNVLTLIG